MPRKKLAVTIIPEGTWPDSSAENRKFWLSRPPAERIEAGKRLRRKYWRLAHGKKLQTLSRVARPFTPHRP